MSATPYRGAIRYGKWLVDRGIANPKRWYISTPCGEYKKLGPGWVEREFEVANLDRWRKEVLKEFVESGKASQYYHCWDEEPKGGELPSAGLGSAVLLGVLGVAVVAVLASRS